MRLLRYIPLLLCLLVVGAAAQNQYYVAVNSGNDSNTGTSPGSAWKNISHAIATADTSGGAVINVAAGTYTEAIAGCSGRTASLCANRNGPSTTLRFVIKCSALFSVPSSSGCLLRNSSVNGGITVVANNVDVQGFDYGNNGGVEVGALVACTPSARSSGNCTTGNSVHLIGNYIHDIAQTVNDGLGVGCPRFGAIYAGSQVHGTAFQNDVQVIGNRIVNYGSAAARPSNGGSCNEGHGIYINTPNAIVENNVIVQVPTFGIQIYNQACNTAISNNTIDQAGKGGITVANGTTCEQGATGRVSINNNIMEAAPSGGITLGSGGGSPCTPTSRVKITNNLLPSGTTITNGNLNGCTDISGTKTESPAATFASYPGGTSGSYQLKSGSQAIGGGIPPPGCASGSVVTPCVPSKDFTGAAQSSPPSIGAYTFAGSGGPVVSLSSTSLNFGSQSVGSTSATQNVALTNVGTASLTISSIVASGDFAQTNTCPASLGASLSCNISVSFTPTVAGARSGAVTITDNASGSPHVISLSGTGATLSASLTPTSFNFGSSVVGTPTATQLFTYLNTGTGSVTIGVESIGGTNAGDFPFGGVGTCGNGQVLASGSSCTASVKFSPTVVGARSATLSITDNTSGSPHLVTMTGTGVAAAPAVGLSPSSLTFSPQLVSSSSASQIVTLTNTGSATLTISSTAISGDFSKTSTCGASLAPNVSCTFSVTFTPTATGARTGTLTVNDNASGSPHTVALSGTGTAPIASFSPTSVPFGNQVVGSSTGSINVVLTNTGTAALTGIAVSRTGANPGDFSNVNGCGSSLAVNASCTVSVQFTPTTTGSRTANLHFVDSASNSPQDVALSGTGVTSPAPSITLSPSSLTFASQVVSTPSSPQTVLVTNSGNATLTLSSIAVTGANSGDFGLSNPCGSSLGAGLSCTLSVTFTPSGTGARSAAITITDNASGSPHSVALSGAGVAAPVPIVSLSTTSLTFSSQNVGSSSASQPVVVNNTGTATLAISSISASGDYSQTNNCTSVAAGSSCTINVTFTPTTIGSRAGTLTITDNASGSPHTVSLSGTGLGAIGGVSPSSLTFGNQGLGTGSVAQSVTVSNTGNISQTVSLSFTGANAADFGEADNCSGSIAAGGNCLVNIVFTPSATGSRSASLVVTGNATNSPQTVPLSGTGVQASLSISPTTIAFGSQPVGGATAAQTTTLTNVGGTSLTLTSFSITGSNSTEFLLASGGTCVPGTPIGVGNSCTIRALFQPISIGSKSASITIVDNAPGSPHMVALTGTGTSVILALSPTSLAFGNQPVTTTSSPMTSTLTNNGTADEVISSIGLGGGGNPGDYSTSNDCPGTLGPSAFCTITVRFIPTTSGLRTATINIVGTVNASLPLTGTGTQSGVSFNPASRAFGSQTIQTTSSAQNIVLTNGGAATLNISSISLLKTSCSATFSDTFNTGTLDAAKWTATNGSAPGGSTVNTSTFASSHVSLAQGLLQLNLTQAGASNPITSIGGEIVSIPTFGFGTYEWVMRSGSSSLTPNGAGTARSGQVSGAFNFINNSQTEIDFEIEGQTPNIVELTNWTSTSTNQTSNTTLTGSDAGFHDYKFVWMAGEIDFYIDNVLVSTHTQNVPNTPAHAIINFWGTNGTGFGGTATINVPRQMYVSRFSYTPPTCGAATDYAQTNTCGSSLAPGGNCAINVTFTPAAIGESDAEVQVASDAPTSPNLAPLTGIGVLPTVVLSPPNFNFGSQAVSTTSGITAFTVTNNGVGAATISSVSVIGTDASQFTIVSTNCITTLAPQDTCSISVTFHPSSPGAKSAVINVASNAEGAPQQSASLGTGIVPPGGSSLVIGGGLVLGGNGEVGVNP